MIYEIQEFSTIKGTADAYLIVHFWRTQADKDGGAEPFLINDFTLPNWQPEGRRIVRDGSNRLKKIDGTFVAQADAPREQPGETLYERETFERDIAAEVAQTIEDFMGRAAVHKFEGDYTPGNERPFFIDGKLQPTPAKTIERDDSDPNGLLAHPAVAAIRETIETRKPEGGRPK